MKTLKALCASLMIAATAWGCSGNPCQDLADDIVACWQGVDCSTKPMDMQAACMTAKAAATASGGVSTGDSCEGNAKTAAEACLVAGVKAENNCSCVSQ
jgi:hypothetical protein